MRSIGIVRNVDELGRIVLPMELREMLDIKQRDSLEIFVDETTIFLKKYEPGCIFCGNVNDAIHYKGKNICRLCNIELKK